MVIGLVVLGIILGLVAGAFIEELGSASLWGALWGAVTGYLLGSLARVRRGSLGLAQELGDMVERLAVLERRISRIESAPPAPPAPPSLQLRPPAPAPHGAAGVAAGAGQSERDPITAFSTRVREILLGGNTVVRVGILVLLMGVALLAKYAVDHAVFPVELRLTAAALIGVGLVSLGWRLRLRRHGYAVTLQGGGIGTAYLTIFFALRVYELVPPLVAFPLLVALALFSGTLAVLQDAAVLAVVSIVAGFLAPIIASTGAGNHVVLFSYYLLLNAGILGMALFKAWRPLNLLGFAFTFGVATAWGALKYAPRHFATTEPFLVAFFLFYVAIAVLYAWRQPPRLRGLVDGTLVFGAPLAAFSLQAGMVHGEPFGLAWSALAPALFYLGLATALLRRAPQTMRNLVEAFLAIGVGFGTVAVPLALDDHHLTATAWALEGAGLVWVGVRQRRLLPRVAGLLLQLGAGLAFAMVGFQEHGVTPSANSRFLGCAMLALAGLFVACYLHRHRERTTKAEQLAAHGLLWWGLLWWLAGAAFELEAHVPARLLHASRLGLAVLTALGLDLAARRLSFRAGRLPPVLLVPVMLGFVLTAGLELPHPLAGGGALVWPVAFACALWLLRRQEGARAAAVLAWLHAGLLWTLAIAATWEAAYWTYRGVGPYTAWPLAATLLVPAMLAVIAVALVRRPWWPAGKHADAYLVYGTAPLILFLLGWGVILSLGSTGEPRPLPYIPVASPVDLAAGIGLVAALGAYAEARRRGYPWLSGGARAAVHWVAAACVFAWLNGVVLRAVHWLAEVPFDADRLWESVVLQTALSIVWTLLALGVMLFATRSGWRVVWIAGACLVGVVVLKLFLVDLSALGTAARIISFLVVGALLLLVGYLSPVPPARPEGPALQGEA